jgi:hypothetical protein
MPIAQMEGRPRDSNRIIAPGFEQRLFGGNDEDLAAILSPHAIAAAQQPAALHNQSRLFAAV